MTAALTPFFALVRKDLILFLSDRRAMLINLVLPIALATFFGYLFGGAGPAKTGAIDVALVQQDTGEWAARSAPPQGRSESAPDRDEPRRGPHRGRQGQPEAAIVIPAGFGEAAGAALFNSGDKPSIDVLYDPSQSAALAMVKGLLTQQVMQIVSAEMFGGKAGREFTDQSLGELEAEAANDPDKASLARIPGQPEKVQAHGRRTPRASETAASPPA